MRTGVAFRPELAAWLSTRPPAIECVEVRVDPAVTARPLSPPELRDAAHVVVNAPRLSLGAREPLSPADLCNAMRAACAVDAVWISTYLGSRRRPEPEFSYPDPLMLGRAALGRAVERCRQIIDTCGRPLLVENVAAFRRVEDSMSESEFLARLCDETGCGLLLDVTALAVDARLGFDPRRWLGNADPHRIVAIRLGGWTERGRGRWAGRHEGRIPDDVWTLTHELIDFAPIQAAILQSDGRFSGINAIESDLERIVTLGSVAQHHNPSLDGVYDSAQVRWRYAPAKL